MNTAAITPASGVRAPAAKFTTLRENPPVTGKPPDMALARLAAPRPRSSASGLIRSPRLIASDCATDTLSTKPMSAIITAGKASACNWPSVGSANVNAGSPAGMAPTTATPALVSSSKATTVPMASRTTTIGASFATMSAFFSLMPA